MDKPNSLKGLRALICGASGGIGRETALLLARFGADVIPLARTEQKLQLLQKNIQNEQNYCSNYIVCDLDNYIELEKTVFNVIGDKPIDILINNSSGPAGGPILEAAADEFLQAFKRHILSSHTLTKLLLPGMKKKNYGRIINIISTSVYEPIPGLGVSNTIRGAMASWSKTVARELPPGITINNILPGYTDTARLTSLMEAKASTLNCDVEEIKEMWINEIPEGRLAEPQETAQAIAFLCSPAASYIRGVSLPVDGGRMRGI